MEERITAFLDQYLKNNPDRKASERFVGEIKATKSPSSMTMYMIKRFIVSGRIERPAQLLEEVDAGDLTAGE